MIGVIAISGIIAIIVGIIVLVWPRSLSIAVGLYLLIVGIIQLVGGWGSIIH